MREEFKTMVEERGFRVSIGTALCKQYSESHENCVGCGSHQGCARLAHIMCTTLKASMYKPTSFEDSMKRDKWVAEQMKHALDKDYTIDQLKKDVI